MIRRVRDKRSLLQLSKRAKAFHPGQGVYRSSYKNARRLTATENNIAYRTADYLRYQQMDFVVGIQICLSNNHTVLLQPGETTSDPTQQRADGSPKTNAVKHLVDICDDLQGRYPKDFKFTGWHPHCRCHVITILKSKDEIKQDIKRLTNGETVDNTSVNEVTELPKNFTEWVQNNEERLKGRATLPYFIRENESKEWFRTSMTSRYDEVYIARMRDKGIRITEGAINRLNNSSFNNLDIDRLNDNIQGIFSKHGGSELSLTVREYNDSILLRWRGEDGLSLERSFFVDEQGRKVVDHELFRLPTEMQGKGISKQIFRVLYEQYKAAGVERIEVYANIDVGGYTWARYGFCAKDRDTVLNAVRFYELTPRQEKRIMTLIDEHFNASSDPFPMNKIARLPYGKKALLGSNWDGALDLTDPVQVRTFEWYLRR